MQKFDVVIIGGGPAGLAAALSADKFGASTLIIERENRLGGILKQCIHDGFGVIKFKERLTGPEYSEKYIDMLKVSRVNILKKTFVKNIQKKDDSFIITVISSEGVKKVEAVALVLATGCRERTAKQISIHGNRPVGVYTAGTAQHFVNLMGSMPCKKCVILGSGDIGLIMARRLTLEGARVIGVYEAKPTPSGLTRNIHQCLYDFNIPLHLSHTVTKVLGEERVQAVEICKVDESMSPIKGTEKIVECDSLILSVGLIPENEVAQKLGIEIDAKTRGPIVDQNFMTSCSGVFSCGNSLHVNDLVDYVSESAELAGLHAAKYAKENNRQKTSPFCLKNNIEILIGTEFLYVVPQIININKPNESIVTYFRSSKEFKDVQLSVLVDNNIILKRKYSHIKPPEMERIVLKLSEIELTPESNLIFKLDKVV